MNIQNLIEKYLDTESYGANLILKECCSFPKTLPLPCHIEHGWTALPDALITDLNVAASKGLMLVYSTRRKTAWQKKSKIPVIISGPPFVLFRKLHKIKPTTNAKGTVAFPSHSAMFVESNYDIEDYCKELKNLPAEFKPVTICLLYPDIKRGKDKIYKKHGFEVVSAGEKVRGSLDFVKKYYEILMCHKYSTSNEVGTYAFYSVEMGIPFFLTGDEPTIVNIGDKDPNISSSGKMSDHELGQRSNQIFGHKPNKKVTKEQKQFLEDEFGSNVRADIKFIRKALWNNTKSVQYWLVKVPMFYLMTLVKYLVPHKLAYYIFEKLSK